MAILIDGLDMPEQGEYKHLRIYDNGDVTVEVGDGEAVIAHAVHAADVVSGRDFRDCRNELCLRCGDYTRRHLGACDGCRWRDNG